MLFRGCVRLTTTGGTVFIGSRIPAALDQSMGATAELAGGMGIIVLAVAILPLLGVGGMQIYRPKCRPDERQQLTPRIGQTAKFTVGRLRGTDGGMHRLL